MSWHPSWFSAKHGGNLYAFRLLRLLLRRVWLSTIKPAVCKCALHLCPVCCPVASSCVVPIALLVTDPALTRLFSVLNPLPDLPLL
ncbi:unnamed protein product, partial [Staurois parvus]